MPFFCLGHLCISYLSYSPKFPLFLENILDNLAKIVPRMDAASENDRESLPTASSDLEFITFTDINQITQPETKKRVRSHVMHRIQRDLRQNKGRKGQIVLDVSSLSQASAGRSRDLGSEMAVTAAPRPYDIGAGRSNPFANYPIAMNLRTHELFDHLYGDTCPMFKTMSEIGFFKYVLDEAGFRQILCTSSAHITMLREETDTAEAITLSNEALTSINKRLDDPALSTSDGVLVSILAFACHAVMFNDAQGTLIHLNGLEEIIRRRGGLQTLASNPTIRIVLFWVDINTAFFHDRNPRFPSPDDILPKVDLQSLLSPSGPTLLDACITEEMTEAINELICLSRFMMAELAVRQLWEDAVFGGLNVVPVLSKLLSIRYDNVERDPVVARQESCRIAAILYVSAIRIRFGVKLAARIYVPKLKDSLLAQDRSDLEMSDPILLWVFTVGGLQSFNYDEHNWFVLAVANLIVHRRINTWDEFMEVISAILWIDSLLEAECNKFRDEISSDCWDLHRHVFS